MATAYEKAAAKLEAEKKASEALRKKASKSIKGVKHQGGPARQAIKAGTKVKGRNWVSSLKSNVKAHLSKMKDSVGGKKPYALKAVKGNISDKKKALKNNLTKKELDRFRRK